ncbi:hypothetical protein GLAREA_02616 [Glarea lozoyensis ATCC 20868]|uniref:Uncharacterized protein n=1 Tax=Glarea lozoyensis (strain ATCC 20868 / MF5171) TaxID=1116229 RepID=S3DJH5_GLAL2|nr:uncharacterized protein GLAREA_02616 [Glarea lozoyensis ATCC 20868]EPE26703.1 hypothetical protein GLAREA_02616 [Glarea lozoyensis ATCC 20868]
MSVGNLRWLKTGGDEKVLSHGISFGMPWAKGLYQSGQTFTLEGNGQAYPLDCREIAFWPDGSLKWTAHSVSGNIKYCENYTVQGAERSKELSPFVEQKVKTTFGLELELPAVGSSSLFTNLSIKGQIVCSRADIIASIDKKTFNTIVRQVEVENATFSRILIKVSGVTVSTSGDEHLPFDVRIYVYQNTSTIRIVHSFTHDLDCEESLTSLGIRFHVPFGETELYNRHIRFGGCEGGILGEEVQGLSGLRFGPTVQNRIDQTAGKHVTLSEEEWKKTELSKGLACIPSWDAYTLSQLSSDGFNLKKRTKAGCSWVKVTAGSRADGTSYVGSAQNGGLAVSMVDFWERYPTQLDLSGLTTDTASMTVWLYSPLAEPLETSPYHDGLGLDTYSKQLEGLDVTYEDYEPGLATANGIGRSNQLFLKLFTSTPTHQELSTFSSFVRDPPRLVPTPGYMHATGVFHGCWAPDNANGNASYFPSPKELHVEQNLAMLFNFYNKQVEQHRWYGFWDYGDVQHTYDAYRHAWRYDVGGFAWDNSELSTDLWLWLYFLHTGRADVFKMAEAMTQHTSEVDVYHTGRFKGFGTRHGVQHWSDSSKQLRISNVLYRRIYFYLTGDERTGDLIEELSTCQNALYALDSHRKVQQHGDVPQDFAMANIGLDCGPLAAAWLTAWERRTEGWENSRKLLVHLLEGIASLPHGIANNAALFNPKTGEMRVCPPPTPDHAISHLSMLFSFPEIFTELLDYAKDDHASSVEAFKRKAWFPYMKAYNGTREVQVQEYGFEWDFTFPPDATWRQSHSTLTAIVAAQEKSEERGKAAWAQFFGTDGYSDAHDWSVIKAEPPNFFNRGEEAPWITTNEAARYGVSAIFNLANIREYL